jgi:hypothetical protein
MNCNSTLSQKKKQSAGYLMVLVLVFSGIFFTIVSGFVGYVITQNKLINFRYEQQRATEIAEAGLNFYKWYLAHYPSDLTTGVGLPHIYNDPVTGTPFGEFTLQVASTTYCGSIASIEVESTAFTYQEPDAVSTVRAVYTRPTIADYTFISNTGVWYGNTELVYGPIHSNQGVRMDAFHNSVVGSGQSTWTCDSSYGCTPNKVVDGVYAGPTANSNPALFSYPVSPIDFAGITLDLVDIKNRAQNNGGKYYAPSGVGNYGYRLNFKNNGTYEVWRVSGVDNTYNSYDTTLYGHAGEGNVISAQTLLETVAINPSCPVIFIEDKTWVQGEINQKVTLAAANLTSGSQTNIVLQGNITYTPSTEAGFLAIAEDDIDLGLTVPNNMTVQGIFVAQNGRFGRNYYCTNCSVWSPSPIIKYIGLPAYLDAYASRNSLDVIGTIVSKGRAVTDWGSSGFVNNYSSYDPDQVLNPPPLTPETSDVYTFKDWRHD